jgi:hypothetical protein
MANLLNFPSFKDSHCFYFEVCGKLRRARSREERSQKIARIRTARGSAYLRLVRGGNPGGHLHVDLALARFFPTLRPEVGSTRGEIEREIAAHFDETVDVFVFAQYATAITEIQPGAGVVFAGPSAVVSTINSTAVEVGGAHLVLRNEGFVRTIDWQIFKEDTVFSDILSHCETKVSRNYIADLFARTEKAHATYILGRTVDASTQP